MREWAARIRGGRPRRCRRRRPSAVAAAARRRRRRRARTRPATRRRRRRCCAARSAAAWPSSCRSGRPERRRRHRAWPAPRRRRVDQLPGRRDDGLWIALCDSGFQRLRRVAQHAGEFLGVRLDQVGGAAVERVDQRGERRVGGVDRDPARVRREARDDVGVPGVGHAGRQRAGQHHPGGALGRWRAPTAVSASSAARRAPRRAR